MTPTALCNVALGHIGQARIADIGERSPAAEHCRRMFDHVRRLCLRDHDWNFAVRRSALTALDAAPPFGYSVAYQLPTDCLRILSINGQPAGVRGANWEVEGRTVLCNASYAHLRYIADAEDTEQWDDMFGGYFAYRLAAHIAPSFRLDPQSAVQLEQMAAALRASAQEADRVETAPMVTRLDQSEIIQERGGWASGTAYGTGPSNASGSTIGWGSIAVAGQSTVVATVAGDTFTLVAGTNVTITTDNGAKTITISASGGGGAGTTDLAMTRTGEAVTITSSTGTDAEIPQANATHAGVMTAAHHNKLNDLPDAAALTAALSGKANTSHTHTLSFTGAVTGSGTTGGAVALSIAANAVGPAELAPTAVTAGTYANPGAITVDADGRITSISSGNLLFRFFPRENEPPATSFATSDTRGDHPILNFDETNTETIVFRDYIAPGVTFADSGTAVSIFIDAVAFSATGGVVGWTASFERLAPGGQDLDSPGFGTAQGGSTSINTDSGKIARVQINFTKAQLPSGFAAGDMFRLRIQRNTSVGSDHAADAQFVGCYAVYNPQLPT